MNSHAFTLLRKGGTHNFPRICTKTKGRSIQMASLNKLALSHFHTSPMVIIPHQPPVINIFFSEFWFRWINWTRIAVCWPHLDIYWEQHLQFITIVIFSLEQLRNILRLSYPLHLWELCVPKRPHENWHLINTYLFGKKLSLYKRAHWEFAPCWRSIRFQAMRSMGCRKNCTVFAQRNKQQPTKTRWKTINHSIKYYEMFDHAKVSFQEHWLNVENQCMLGACGNIWLYQTDTKI